MEKVSIKIYNEGRKERLQVDVKTQKRASKLSFDETSTW